MDRFMLRPVSEIVTQISDGPATFIAFFDEHYALAVAEPAEKLEDALLNPTSPLLACLTSRQALRLKPPLYEQQDGAARPRTINSLLRSPLVGSGDVRTSEDVSLRASGTTSSLGSGLYFRIPHSSATRLAMTLIVEK
jgi:hypothetical protein